LISKKAIATLNHAVRRSGHVTPRLDARWRDCVWKRDDECDRVTCRTHTAAFTLRDCR